MTTQSDRFLIYRLIILALLCLTFAITWFSIHPVAVDAAPAPTATVTTPAPITQHWLLENDGDMAYLLTQPGCYLTMQELGEDSRVFTLECDPVRDEGVGVELKDGGE